MIIGIKEKDINGIIEKVEKTYQKYSFGNL